MTALLKKKPALAEIELSGLLAVLDLSGGMYLPAHDTLLVADPLALDFEQANAHTITIAVTDAAGATSQFDVEIQITDWVGEKVTGKDDKNEVIRGGRGNDSLNGGAGTTRSPGAWARTR